MRYAFTVFLGFLVWMPVSAKAAVQQWQEQLQKNIAAIEQASNAAAFDGVVTVTSSETSRRATLPTILFKEADGTAWAIPPIVMTRPTGSDAVAIVLPATVARVDSAGKTIGLLTIGKQNLHGTWNDVAGRLQSVEGNLSAINVQQDAMNVRASVNRMTLETLNAQSLKMGVTGLNASSQANGKTYQTRIEKLDFIYRFSGIEGLGIEQLLGLFRQSFLATLQKPVTIEVVSKNAVFQDASDRTYKIGSFASQVMVTPKKDGKAVDLRNNIELSELSRSPASVSDIFLPRMASMTGTATAMPVSFLNFVSMNNVEALKKDMAASGTRVTFDSIRMETVRGAKLSGNGWLTAAAEAPTGFTGRLTFKMDNFASVMTALQQKMANPEPGADLAAQGQAMVMFMLLQGMGKAQESDMIYGLDLTRDGQILMNGKDVTPLFNISKGLAGKFSETPLAEPAKSPKEGGI